ncbi:MAG: hypothetical protein F4120_04605 [Rhodothermaceae bacterium]|nr:hypothetical protein [Rhodothermaceae bacterium]MXW31766.1 hypothetical protein [Rhodothermaceae bacterium]MYC03211.1 hypothetical protein [Rhodothermaceae bacterium]MYE62944.1 hypothetical protein [Rhodothermaceae bacterium]MYI16883.1 hypothetical protein [Rhodothermaceae bacterium]
MINFGPHQIYAFHGTSSRFCGALQLTIIRSCKSPIEPVKRTARYSLSDIRLLTRDFCKRFRGYRKFKNFRNAILFFHGGLDLYPQYSR